MDKRRAHAIALIRARRDFAKRVGTLKRRRPLPRQIYPRAIELAYFKTIRQVVEHARAVVARRVLPKLAGWVETEARRRGDAADDEINNLIDDTSSEFFDSFNVQRVKALVAGFGNQTSDYQKEQLEKQVKAALGVDVFQSEPWLAPKLNAWTAENVALIRSVPERTFSEIEALVMRSITAGARAEDIAAEIAQRFDVADTRAALIARDQVGKLFGGLNKERQRDLGVDKFVWRTANDERVRPSHAELEGEEFEWADPPVVDGEPATPGTPIQCRCVPEPVFADVLDGLDEDSAA